MCTSIMMKAAGGELAALLTVSWRRLCSGGFRVVCTALAASGFVPAKNLASAAGPIWDSCLALPSIRQEQRLPG